MPAIIAPSPRLPAQHSQLLTQDPLPFNSSAIHSRTLFSPPRLLSPIRLHDPPYFALSSKSPTPCGPPYKRRAPSRHFSRSTRRRRHAQRVDCPLDAFGRPSIFDQLPWISALEMPSSTNCDIADLSQLPLNEDPAAFSDTMPASGPVRRRKTSLRSNPLGGHESPPSEPLLRQHSPVHRPTDSFPDCPKTPPPRVPFDPSKVTFHNLMPVFPRGVNPSTPF
ncbi:hypothetical protein HD554DRAFT_163389 [Boletus coccyginus]|nr:hypothetical protein HD554DRAFT_163389 [Boletus coccyginus]